MKKNALFLRLGFIATCLLTQACTQQINDTKIQADAVSDAYNTSGLIATSPYTRTIFSSHNF